MLEIHKSKYSQGIPGISKIDDEINFIHGERSFSSFNDGLPHPEKLLAAAADAEQRGRHARVFCENLNESADKKIGEAFVGREKKLKQWTEHLNQEVDALTEEIASVGECERNLQKWLAYFGDLSRASRVTSDFRRQIVENEPSDRIEDLRREETVKLNKAAEDMQKHANELSEIKRKLEDARKGLMSEVKIKAMSINIDRRCNHSTPVPSFPYRPEDHPVDQIYHPNSLEDWEEYMELKLLNAVALHREATRRRCLADLVMQDDSSDVSDAWRRTNKAIEEVIRQDERSLYNVTNILKTINDSISSTKLRAATLSDVADIQALLKSLHLWRLQNLTYRPGHEHIRDEPVLRLDEEINNIKKKTDFLEDGMVRNRSLLRELHDEKKMQTIEMDRLTRKLFIERENCLGMRRAIGLEGED